MIIDELYYGINTSNKETKIGNGKLKILNNNIKKSTQNASVAQVIWLSNALNDHIDWFLCKLYIIAD